MRYLTYFTAGLVGACLLRGYGIPVGAAGEAAVLLGCFLSWLYGKRRKIRPVLPLILSGILAGLLLFGVYENLYLKPARQYRDRTVTTEFLVTRYPEKREKGCRVRGILRLEGIPYGAELYLPESQELEPGNRLTGRLCLQLALRTEAGSYARQGAAFQIFPEGELSRFPMEAVPAWTAPARLSRWLQEKIGQLFPADTAGFAKALLLGDSSGLSYDTRWALERSGIRHMVAVSGLHVTVLCALLGKFTRKRKYLTFLLGIPMLGIFAAVIGFTPSVMRACIMMGMFLLARVLRRQYEPVSELAAAVLLMVTVQPLTVLEPGFQLSCASVLGIFLIYPRIHEPLRKRIPWKNKVKKRLLSFLAESVCLSLSATALVLPLTAFYFGSISLIGPLTNLVTIWLVPLLFWGILLVLALGVLLPGPAALLGAFLSFGIRWVLAAAEFFSAFPLAAVYTHNPAIWVFLIFFYGFGLYCLWGREKKIRLYCLGTLGAFLLTLTVGWGLPHLARAGITMLDVGQGQCVLLRSRGRAYLVDCGGDRDEYAGDLAAKTLLSQGVTRLDGLILSHFDRDHVGGAPYLLKHIPADAIYLPDHELLPADPRIRRVKELTRLNFSDTSLWIYPGKPRAEGNEMSLAVLLDSQVYDILITGDLGEEGEAHLLSAYSLPRVDCLAAGHHGSAGSTSEQLLRRIRPKTALISAGKNNRYGHPAESTLLRLRAYGCQIRRTDLDGTITIWR